jgi:hypothetical protein
MIEYIKEYCELPPLNRPEFDDDTGTWDLYFAEKEVYNPYRLEQELICVPFDTLEEAQATLKQALELYETNETEAKENKNEKEQ